MTPQNVAAGWLGGSAHPGQQAVPEPGHGTWFEAATPIGPLHLQANTLALAASHAAAAAMGLNQGGELLVALERWVGADLAWRWCPTPPPSGADGSQASVQWPDAQSLLVCDWRVLRALPPPPEALARQMHWPSLRAVLSVACLQLDSDELRQLEPGGAVLLPASLQPLWHGRLRGVDEPARAGVPVALPTPRAPRLVRGNASARAALATDEAGPCAYEVRLGTTYMLSGDRLTGWFDEVLEVGGSGASLWRCASAREPASCLASGPLMPWGDGWALALESLGGEEASCRVHAEIS